MTTTLQKPAARAESVFSEFDFGEFHHIWCMTTRNLFDLFDGPTQAFRGQCINKSLFKFIVIYLCKTYSSTLRRT